jgi:hypothetical protein
MVAGSYRKIKHDDGDCFIQLTLLDEDRRDAKRRKFVLLK